MNDLLSGHEVGIGVGPHHARQILGRVRPQRRQDVWIDLEGTERAEHPPGFVLGLIERDLAVVDGVAHCDLGQIDVGLGLPGEGGGGRWGHDGNGDDGRDNAPNGGPP